ncbi:hypothetical protein N8198_06750 [Gammaproteobacteria bacterium]|nr:hypothetical protein [Gammaproteobacteria bacterium]
MKNHLAQTAIALLFLTVTNAYAACTRDDIDYYLSKGFTQEQIAAICTEATEAAAPSTTASPEAEADIAVVPPTGGSNEDAERYLREAINGDDVRVEGGFLHYTARICIPYGRFNDNKEPLTKETCEQVRYKVTLRGMEAKREWLSENLLRPRQVFLQGQIEREIVSDLDGFNSVERRQIIENLQTEVKAVVPIKENMSHKRLIESLNKIAI